MPDRIRLDGRIAVVTGAGGAIGTATMHALADRGALIVAYRFNYLDLLCPWPNGERRLQPSDRISSRL